MKRSTRLMVTVVCLALTAWPCLAGNPGCDGVTPSTPAGVEDVVYARPFTLEEPYQSSWRQERPEVRSGYILVFKVDPALVAPKATAEPVLYASDQIIERINTGQSSGYVVGILPRKARLEGLRFWFGEPGFPDSLGAGAIHKNRELAVKAGVGSIKEDSIVHALKAGGRKLRVATKSELLQAIAPLILEYSPDEQALVNTLEGRPPGD